MDKTFKPTPDWMAAKYAELNQSLFRGELGECDFGIFTTGRGSQGGVLGWFKITGRGIKIERFGRRMFVFNPLTYNKTYINKQNFVQFCRPRIELNGNYSGTENGFLATLAHEMCHYYNYMYGVAPKQAHGPEFKQIGSLVSARSNGLFTIQRLASAEQMSELELSAEMKAKKENRLNNKKASVFVLLVILTNGEHRLSNVSNEDLVRRIVEESRKRKNTAKILLSKDPDLINEVFSKGYKSVSRTWRYWPIKDTDWIVNLFENSEHDVLYDNTGTPMTTTRPVVNDGPKLMFSINTNNGPFQVEFKGKDQLAKILKNKFPFMSDETLRRIIDNNSNYKMSESKKNINDIITETINKFLDEEIGDSIEINPEMNLGLESPLEME
jgi:predicted SprT family Zn-dependent metalloprotease